MSMIEDQTVVINEGEVTQLLINRPKSLNALNMDVLQSLLLAFERISKNSKIRAVTIWGSGDKAFVAGADIHSMVDLGQRAIADYVELGQRTMRAIEMCAAPVIAAVNGYALGGGMELALACDLIIASSSAKFGQPEVGLGIIPGFGATQRLTLRCGLGTARRLIYSGEIIDAQEAERLGVADVVAPEGKLTEAVEKMTKLIVSRAPLAVQKSKEVLRQSTDTQLLAGLRNEVEGFLKVFNSADREEGMRAFMQKRDPKFSNS